MNPKFQLGQVVMTRGIAALMTDDFEPEMRKCLERHHYGDWGDVCDEDKALNDAAVNEGFRLLSAYTVQGTKIWIITEADRSVTTILLPEEY